MTTPLVEAPLEEPVAPSDASSIPPFAERLGRPFRLGIVGLGAALGLFARLGSANGFGAISDRPVLLTMAATSAIAGLGLLLIAAERDRFGPPLVWISGITAAAWGTLNWISPPFDEGVTVWSNGQQTNLTVLGVGNGLLLAGIVALAFVRRAPTLSVASTLLAGVAVLAANTLLLRNEWAAIVALGAAFALVLLAWDRSPRWERLFVPPKESPRVSRAALSFASVALCGAALQMRVSRDAIPRSLLAVIAAIVLVAAAFASLVRVRREIENRETTLSEWTSWMREIRRNDFRTEMVNFEPAPAETSEPPRKLSFPNLTVGDEPSTALPVVEDSGPATAADDAADLLAPAGYLDEPAQTSNYASLADVETWMNELDVPDDARPLVVAVEAMSLAEYEALPPADASVATEEIAGFLAEELPSADLVAWIDGPYFLIPHQTLTVAELNALNAKLAAMLKGTDGAFAFVRLSGPAPIDEIVDNAVAGILRARQLQDEAR